MAESVKVAVRVRPFNERERTRNASLIISMNGNQTEIKNPQNQSTRSFAFDYSYWSHDSFKERDDGYLEPSNSKYADQQKVFNDLGRGVLTNAWKGFNCSLFAYGQTGSGKSYSIVGYGTNKGIVPLVCEELFSEIEKKRSTAGKDEEYQVDVSMLEIYNEHVRDLLNIKETPKGGLKVRQHPTKGFVVEKLTSRPANSYRDIDVKISEGTHNRTVASTNMNATSSRAHTIFTINFTQKTKNETGENMTRTSSINLVDLAGSERVSSTGATGDRLKEGSSINQSLSSLGNVIKALADLSGGISKVIVPYRDSVLTRLLKNALGGNSKTIMIAALSPADLNYDETLSTLKFADRAKAIKTSPTVNESPTDKLIRELKEENARLMKQLKGGGSGATGVQGYSQAEVEEMKKTLEEEMKQRMEDMKKTWQQRLAEAEEETVAKVQQGEAEMEQRKVTPHFWNLNEDPSLTANVIHFCNPGVSQVGNGSSKTKPDILLKGLSILPQHASVTNTDGVTSLQPLNEAKVLVNGVAVQEQTTLHHNDRVMFGSNHLYVFHNPKDEALRLKSGKKTESPTFNAAQEEINGNSGMGKMMKDKEGKSKEDLLLMEELLKILPLVRESNAISEELGKNVQFDVTLCHPQFMGNKDGDTVVYVTMKQLSSGNEWLWDKNKFINRKYMMQEMYQNYMEGDSQWDLPKAKDPFWEPADLEILIGCAPFFLSALAYGMEAEQDAAIRNFKGDEKGELTLEAVPCTAQGKELRDDCVEQEELMNRPMYLKINIISAKGLPANINSSFCQFKFYLDKDVTKTVEIKGTTNPTFNHTSTFSFPKVTQEVLQYLEEEAVYIQVYGRQKESGFGSGNNKSNTGAAVKSQPVPKKSAKEEAEETEYKAAVELSTERKRAARAENKLTKVKAAMENSKGADAAVQMSELKEAMNSGLRFKGTTDAVMVVNQQKSKKKDNKNKSKTCLLQ